MKQSYKKQMRYWECVFIVFFSQCFGLPIYKYGWWVSRRNLIKKGEI